MGRLLNLIFSNDNSIKVDKSSSAAVSFVPYHPALDIVFPQFNEFPTTNVSNNYYNIKKANYSDILKYVEKFNWYKTISLLDNDSAINVLCDALHYCILHFIPVSRYVEFNFQTRFSKKLKSILPTKRQSHVLFKSSNNTCYYNQFSNLQAQYKSESKKCLRH